ncbi:hypothetical protein P280DRAFT_436914 [Massarina eburnea CBS 473.64]|uniref:Integral membrane protein n=1 Tax=Massarina eburnea CBS 473.64 TaxID=1395130 RepID=A0A6A6RKF2_9PLEO|nr:hypothetical protein P280DRAFT_436914 [Massarina eburnea CBS 473.64]
MTSHFRLAFVLLGASLVFAAGVMASTNTDNTTVANIVGWEAGPDTRGTLSLVWSCVITIFACTSTVLHLNVPGREDSTSLRVWRKMKWMVITILFPEFIFAKAVCDLRQALAELRDFGDDIQEINGKTKRTLQPPSGDLQIDTAQEMNSKVWKTVQKWTIFHSYYAQMGGLLVPNWSWEPSYGVLTGTVLNAQLQWSSDSDSPLKHLVLSEKDIQDTSKADWSLKSIAVLQIAWLVLSVAVRALTGLPITQLEIATIAFAIMAILTYVTSWWKPKGVSEPKIVQCVSPDKMRIMYTPRIQYMSLWFWSPARSAEGWQRTDCNKRVPNDAILVKGDTPSITVLLAASSLLFGGLHCLAWNFEFPSRTELTCWRVGCLISAVLPAVTVGISTFLSYLSTKYLNQQCFRIFVKEELKDLPEMPSECGILYTSSRLLTIILLFTSLRAVPADVYRTTSWVSFLPNIS